MRAGGFHGGSYRVTLDAFTAGAAMPAPALSAPNRGSARPPWLTVPAVPNAIRFA